ncbi:DNA-3-methyladenine glycosylase I [Desulfopila aestuarii]|uniref:DNA-3-methyladenine glycosylase I n=1 Tax=Desulfopila aestuarii DSM 18488 TaxID=1121416 RepID=A0A1M7XVR1_9BACT|nr:DNA-3-methyladenine glycosylase I [Desulfopila aestuarii]SHO42738.1 DNA-3-methyladenine glycosylase I [Desulfopila aestuarii DSM 18488]
MKIIRCKWCDLSSPEYVRYHDEQWGVPVHDDRLLFEMLVLEGMQAGLSWLSILKKRDNFLKAFDNFDVVKVAGYDEEKVAALLQDAGIVRNRLKINGTIRNARSFLEIVREYGSFDSYIWNWVDYTPVQNDYTDRSEIPAETDLSRRISKDLKKRGMTFVGPVIIYAFMQAIGMVNDHDPDCFRRAEIAAM